MTKKGQISVFAGFLGCLLVLGAVGYELVQRHPDVGRTRGLMGEFREFQRRLAEGDFSGAEEMLYYSSIAGVEGREASASDAEWEDRLRIENGQLLMYGYDIAERVIGAEAHARVTYTYVRRGVDKVVLEGGYALFEDGRIKMIKFP